MKRLLTVVLLLTTISLPSLSTEEIPKKADLPQALIIGDSISIGYTPYVQELLAGRVVVEHHEGNAGHTGNGLNRIEEWIGNTKWDVIHFNWGLHDLCYRHPDSKVYGNRDKVKGTLTTTLSQYENNLEKLVVRLKETDAKLIWARTTVVPEGEAGRKVGDDKKYNEIADKVMKKHGIIINDLYASTRAFPADLFPRPGDVHYTKEGYKKLARQIADKILIIIKVEK